MSREEANELVGLHGLAHALAVQRCVVGASSMGSGWCVALAFFARGD